MASWDEFSERLRDLETREPRPDIISPYLTLLGLRGYWPMSVIGAFSAVDICGHLRTMAYNGNPVYNYVGFVPYIDLDGTGDYLSRADEAGLDIVGTETGLAAAVRGLTIGLWCSPDDAATQESIFGKWREGTNERSYQIRTDGANHFQFSVSTDGAAVVTVTSTGTYTTGEWYLVIGRFDPSTQLDIFVNGEQTTNAVGTPASIDVNTADLNLGARDNGTADYFDGKASQAFLCAAMLSDSIIQSVFAQTRGGLGV